MVNEQLKLAMTDCELNCAECKANHNVCDKDTCKNEIIRQALDKQEFKKPIKCKLESPVKIGNIRFGKGTEILSKCPVCNNWVNGAKEQNYCDNCGQRLDWSGDDD